VKGPTVSRAGVAGSKIRACTGGSFNNDRRNVRCAYRNRNNPNHRNDNNGFRVGAAHILLARRKCGVATATPPRHTRWPVGVLAASRLTLPSPTCGRGAGGEGGPGKYRTVPPPGPAAPGRDPTTSGCDAPPKCVAPGNGGT